MYFVILKLTKACDLLQRRGHKGVVVAPRHISDVYKLLVVAQISSVNFHLRPKEVKLSIFQESQD